MELVLVRQQASGSDRLVEGSAVFGVKSVQTSLTVTQCPRLEQVTQN